MATIAMFLFDGVLLVFLVLLNRTLAARGQIVANAKAKAILMEAETARDAAVANQFHLETQRQLELTASEAHDKLALARKYQELELDRLRATKELEIWNEVKVKEVAIQELVAQRNLADAEANKATAIKAGVAKELERQQYLDSKRHDSHYGYPKYPKYP